jgi:transcriptional regulator with PAS, ATPase and Fis domain
MIILTDAQLVELTNRINQIRTIIDTAQVIKASAAQPKTVTEAGTQTPKPVVSKQRRKARTRRVMLNAAQVVEIKRRLAAGNESAAKIARDYGVHVTTVNLIKYGKTWKEVQVPA